MLSRYARVVRRKWAVRLFVLGSAFLIPLLVGASQELPLSLEETVRRADAIVLGTVTVQQSRWGDESRRWMVTDYTLAVENVLYRSEQGDPISDTVVVTYWGGTIGDETQAISDMRVPVVGERLVMMLRPDWARRFEFSPVVGLNQGLFRVVADASGADRAARIMLDAGGRRLALTATGNVARGTATTDTPVSLAAFEAWLASNVARIKATPSSIQPMALQGDNQSMAAFTKMPSDGRPAANQRLAEGAARPPSEQPDFASVPSPPSGSNQSESYPPAITSPNMAEYVTLGPKPNLPIVVNNFPDSFAPWSPEDEYQMSKWNYYASGVFQVYTTPTGTFNWNNNVFDLAGWPSSSTLQSVYGSPWGANTIGVTFWRSSGGTILEADIALNPAFSFTLDDEWVYDSSSAQGFRQVMLHELGHMLGLDHDFNAMSVMNYMPSVFRMFGIPYMDDAEGIRALYPSNAVSRTDLGVYLYYASGFQSITDATYPASAVAGSNITVNNYQIENVGTTTISVPRIEWYLTAGRHFNSSYYSLGETTYSPALGRFTYYTPSTVTRTFTIPSNVPAGSYYLAAYIRNDAGAGQSSFPFSNNFAFSRRRIAVTTAPPSAPVLISPANNAINVSRTPTLDWSTSSGATSYDVYLGTTTTPPFYVNTTATSFSVGTLNLATKYYWRVVAKNSGGSTSSSTFNFTTVKPDITHLVFRNTTSGDVAAWLLNGLAAPQGAMIYSGLPLIWRIDGIGDLDGDGKADLVLRNTGTGDVGAWLMNGTAIKQGAIVYSGLPLVWQIDRVGDLNGDGKADLILRNTQSGDVAGWLMNGLTVAQGGIIAAGMPLTWRIDGIGDLNGDGRADLVFRHTQIGDVAGWLMNGLTVAQGGIIAAGVPMTWRIDAMGDLNGNGRADLVFRHTQSGDVAGWLMNGLTVAQGGIIAAGVPMTWRIDAMSDVNGDGRADLVFRHTQAGDVAAWLMNGLTVAQGGIISSGLPFFWQIEGIGDLDAN